MSFAKFRGVVGEDDEDPAIAFEPIGEDGRFGAYFNVGIMGSNFLADLDKGLEATGGVDDPWNRECEYCLDVTNL